MRLQISVISHALRPDALRSLLRFARSGAVALVAILLAAASFGACGGPGANTLPRRPTLPESMLLKRADLSVEAMTSLNSPSDDFGVAMPLDSSLLFFTSNRKGAVGEHSIYWSRQSGDGSWSRPVVAPAINNPQSNGMPSIAPGGQILFFAGCDFGFGDCDLYRVTSGLRGAVADETTPWVIPRNLGSVVNSIYWESQPSISADGSLLAFSSNRPGGFGGRDIWIALRQQDGSWGAPLNAGETVNTVFDEVTPWIAPDIRTLYFSSNGHPGIDGFDIYSVGLDRRSGIEVTSDAENLGEPINSKGQDIAFSLSADGSQAFLASNRSGGMGGYDIYRLSAPPYNVEPLAYVSGSVTDIEGRPLIADVEVVNLGNGNVVGRCRTDPETGAYRLVLPRGVRYAVTAQAPSYLYNTRMLQVPPTITTNAEYRVVHQLQGLDGALRLLVFFAPNSSILQRESSVDLDRAVSFMRSNPDLAVEIAGHTDATGTPERNAELSLERATAVKAYIVGNRIPSDRIVVRGYGETRPLASNDTEEGRAKNRRVELRIRNESSE